MSDVELCADGLWNTLLYESEEFGFGVVAGELARELARALTVTRLREDLGDSVPDCLRGRLVGEQVDSRAGPLDVSTYLFLILGKTGRDDRNAVADRARSDLGLAERR